MIDRICHVAVERQGRIVACQRLDHTLIDDLGVSDVQTRAVKRVAGDPALIANQQCQTVTRISEDS